MQERLINIVEGMLIVTTVASFLLVCYVMMALSNMPH
jgi:hypothetical protein